MQQMNSDEQPSYGYYEGSHTQPHQQYGSYDDNFIEALAQRIAQRTSPGSQGKISLGVSSGRKPSAGQRLALAIVSLCLLIPLASILIAGTGGFLGLMALGLACLAIVLVNAFFNLS